VWFIAEEISNYLTFIFLGSLREGMEEMLTVCRLGILPSLARCLATTSVIESPHSGVRLRTRRVCHWRNGQMVLRWAAAALLETEKTFAR
jgi:hypothetical protein